MNWVSVKEKMPPTSNKVLITDGYNISAAHWFDKFAPPHENDPGEWVNQHERLTGGWVAHPTHWASIEEFLSDTQIELYDMDSRPCPKCGKSVTEGGVTWVDENGLCVHCAPVDDEF